MKSIVNDKRKLILLCILFMVLVTGGTFAFYNWRSNDTSVNIGIKDLTVEFISGPDVVANNIGPVLDYHDGVIQTFKVTNGGDKLINFLVEFDISSISDNLLNKTFKYKLLKDNGGGTNYTEEVVEGDFSTLKVGTNKIATKESVDVGKSYSYQFIIYIDGNMKNDIAMQENSLNASLVVNEFEVSYLKSFSTALDKSYFHSDTYRENIKNISFVDYIDTNNAVEEWDMSESNDGSIIAWVTNNGTDGYYDLYIGSNNIIAGRDLKYYFYNMLYVDSIIFNNLDTSNVINMLCLFGRTGYNSTVFTLDLGDKFDTSNVTDMSLMFSETGYSSLSFTLNLGNNFDTSSVTNMDRMFQRIGYKSTVFALDLGDKFDTSNVTNMMMMFENVGRNNTEFTLCLGEKFDTSNVTNMGGMFSETGYYSTVFTLDLGEKFDTSEATNMNGMFSNIGTYNASFTLDLGEKFDTSKVTNMGGMFYFVGVLNPEFILDLGEKFDTSKVTNMEQMFRAVGYSNPTFTLDLGEKFDTSNVTSMYNMFNNTGCRNNNLLLNLTGFNFDKVTNFDNMFYGFSSTKKIYVKDATDKQWILDKGFSEVTSDNVLVKG